MSTINNNHCSFTFQKKYSLPSKVKGLIENSESKIVVKSHRIFLINSNVRPLNTKPFFQRHTTRQLKKIAKKKKKRKSKAYCKATSMASIATEGFFFFLQKIIYQET